MKAVLIAGVLLVAAAGGGAAYHQVSVRGPGVVRYCEALIQSVMKSPASYRRHGVMRAGDAVYIEFDAANGYGALLRQRAMCQFAVPAGQKPGFWDMPEIYRATFDGREIQGLSVFAQAARVDAQKLW